MTGFQGEIRCIPRTVFEEYKQQFYDRLGHTPGLDMDGGFIRQIKRKGYGGFTGGGQGEAWVLFEKALKECYPAAYKYFHLLNRRVVNDFDRFAGYLMPDESKEFLKELEKVDEAVVLEAAQKIDGCTPRLLRYIQVLPAQCWWDATTLSMLKEFLTNVIRDDDVIFIHLST